MLAVVNTPNGKAPVELRQTPEPAPGLHEALVAVQAFSLNRGELRSFRNAEEGWIPGQDISGIVLRQAADGSGPPAGARIVALMDEFGWAERAAVPTQRIAVLPDTVSFAAAAALPVAGLTALRTLRHGAPLLGKRVLITGAAGGVGHLAVQLAARSGARVTAVAGRPERAAGLRELGATDVVVGIEQAQGRFGLILESAGGASLATALHAVDANGAVVMFGNSYGCAKTPFRQHRCLVASVRWPWVVFFSGLSAFRSGSASDEDSGQQRTAVDWRQLCPYRHHERLDADDVHDAGEIVGQYVQRHLAATRFSVFISKWVAPIRALIVPKGCSTVSRR